MNIKPNSYSSNIKSKSVRVFTCIHWLFYLAISSAFLVPMTGFAQPDTRPQPVISYQPSTTWTTPFGPPAADILLQHSNFLQCTASVDNPIALCYYSGPQPEGDGPDLSCTLTDDSNFSNCRCIEINTGSYFVDINSILDEDIYNKTVKKCGHSGEKCAGVPDMAPVCQDIKDKKLLADASPPPDVISTFSLQLETALGYQIGSNSCTGTEAGKYSGCMTAPCVRTDEVVEICQKVGAPGDEVVICGEAPIDICTCPNWTGPYQIGSTDAECHLGPDYTWSAAYNPKQELITKLVPKVSALPCLPDKPGDGGCSLLPPIDPDAVPPEPYIPPVPSNVNCSKVCNEYKRSINDEAVQVGYTCDATVCTTPPIGSVFDPLLIKDACQGLGSGVKGSLSEIAKLEAAASCSCCASQICGCESNVPTKIAVDEFNAAQQALGIETQCEYNGTLCGTK